MCPFRLRPSPLISSVAFSGNRGRGVFIFCPKCGRVATLISSPVVRASWFIYVESIYRPGMTFPFYNSTYGLFCRIHIFVKQLRLIANTRYTQRA